MSALSPLLAGLLVALALAPGALRSFADNGWLRENYRGRRLPFPGGVIAVAAALLATGALAAADELAGTALLSVGTVAVTDCRPSDGHCLSRDTLAALAGWTLPLLAGVAFLGLADDLLEAPARGWRGHVAALRRGRPTTGALKAAGTPALAAVVLSGVGFGAGAYVLAVAVVVLATNVCNLLDLRPGRAAKGAGLVIAGVLAGTGDTDPLRPLGAFAGALLVLAAFDLRERTMLGDTGANVLGALLGLWLVLSLGVTGQVVALVAMLAVTAFGELRSISETVERVGALRALDRLGRAR